LYLTVSPLAISSAKIIPQQIYSAEVAKILINDMMKLLKPDEKLGRFSSGLYICHKKAIIAVVE